MITTGRYRGDSQDKVKKDMTHILIMDKIPPDPKSSADGRMFHGIAIPIKDWYDVKRAFAYYMMFMDSLSISEIELMFGLDDTCWEHNVKLFDDGRVDNLPLPAKNYERAKQSKEKAEVMVAAIEKWKPGQRAARQQSSRHTILTMKQEENRWTKHEDDDEDDGNATNMDGSDFSDADDAQPKTEKTKTAAKTQPKTPIGLSDDDEPAPSPSKIKKTEVKAASIKTRK